VAATAVREAAHSGRWSVKTQIKNAYRAKYGNRAVRLMIWTDKPWNQQGQYFPPAAYYSTWMYFPHRYSPEKSPPWDPGDGGWWNVFQFKSEDKRGESQPVWTLSVASEKNRGMFFYLYSDLNDPSAIEQSSPVYFRERQWIHVEAYFRSAVGKRGQITIVQDGKAILNANSVTTSLGGKTGRDTHTTWGIGNYTDHIAGDPGGEGRAMVYFDDSAVSRVPLAPFANRSKTDKQSTSSQPRGASRPVSANLQYDPAVAVTPFQPDNLGHSRGNRVIQGNDRSPAGD
jgi:hypothetical protein